jgi:hypothetical protein
MLDIWKQLIETRIQTTSWDLDFPVDIDVIRDIVGEVHKRAPSKQNGVRYKMHLLDWSNTELRNDLYEFAVDRNQPSADYYHYNSQVLSNWLVVFTSKLTSFTDPTSDFAEDKSKSDIIGHMEIGLASYFLIHGAKARDLDSGFCRCYDYNYQNKSRICEALDIEQVEDIFLMIGIGKAKTRNTSTTLNLHTGLEVDSASDRGFKWRSEPKPDPSEYIFYHV